MGCPWKRSKITLTIWEHCLSLSKRSNLTLTKNLIPWRPLLPTVLCPHILHSDTHPRPHVWEMSTPIERGHPAARPRIMDTVLGWRLRPRRYHASDTVLAGAETLSVGRRHAPGSPAFFYGPPAAPAKRARPHCAKPPTPSHISSMSSPGARRTTAPAPPGPASSHSPAPAPAGPPPTHPCAAATVDSALKASIRRCGEDSSTGHQRPAISFGHGAPRLGRSWYWYYPSGPAPDRWPCKSGPCPDRNARPAARTCGHRSRK